MSSTVIYDTCRSANRILIELSNSINCKQLPIKYLLASLHLLKIDWNVSKPVGSLFPELCPTKAQANQLIRIVPIDQLPIMCLIKINENKKSLEELTRYRMDFLSI